MQIVYLLLVTVTTAWVLGGLFAVLKVRTARRPLRPRVWPAVTVLKPLKGVTASLEDNLRTFFCQDYPSYEIVFGLEGADDPARDVVERLAAEYPEVTCRLVVHPGGRGLNPKVSNLRAMLLRARHDVIVISDANVAVHGTYLRELACELRRANVGLVTNLIVTSNEQSFTASLEGLEFAGPIAAGIALPTAVLGHPTVVGKSMMFRRSVFENLGGFESVADLLAEDYVIGRMFHSAGYAVRVAPSPVVNVDPHGSFQSFLMRHLRWAMLRSRLQPVLYLLEPLTRPWVIALVAPVFDVPIVPALIWADVLTLLRDFAQWTALRGPRGFLRAASLRLVRDVVITGLWTVAPFLHRVRWRGTRVRLSAGTRLYREG